MPSFSTKYAMNSFQKYLNDDSMTLLFPSLFTKHNLIKSIVLFPVCFVSWTALKRLASGINKRYLRPPHWFKLYEWTSSAHPELHVLIRLHAVLSPLLYFHGLFSFHIGSYSKRPRTNSVFSRSRPMLTTFVLIGSVFLWFDFVRSIKYKFWSKSTCIASFCCHKALECIDDEEGRWRQRVSDILCLYVDGVRGITAMVIEYVGNSGVFSEKQKSLKLDLDSSFWHEFSI